MTNEEKEVDEIQISWIQNTDMISADWVIRCMEVWNYDKSNSSSKEGN